MTILIHFHQSRYRDFKSYYTLHVQRYLRSEFPALPCYARFVALMLVFSVSSACFGLQGSGESSGSKELSAEELRAAVLTTCPMAPCIIEGEVTLGPVTQSAVPSANLVQCESTAPEPPYGNNWNYNFRIRHYWEVNRGNDFPFPIEGDPWNGGARSLSGISISLGTSIIGLTISTGPGKHVAIVGTGLSMERDGSVLIETLVPGVGVWRPRYRSSLTWRGVVNPIIGNEIMFVNELTECYFH